MFLGARNLLPQTGPMEFSRQEYRSELPFPTPGNIFLTQGLNTHLLHLLHQYTSFSVCLQVQAGGGGTGGPAEVWMAARTL